MEVIFISNQKKTSLQLIKERSREIEQIIIKISRDRIIFALGIAVLTISAGTILLKIIITENFFDYLLLGVFSIGIYAAYLAYKTIKKVKISAIENKVEEIIKELIKVQRSEIS